jgi:PBP1b-binding outer membrane lipoprotein LpoB
MKYVIIAVSSLAFLAGCVAPPSSPMEASARKAAAAELTAKRCAGYAGGYESVQKLRQDANKNIAIARSLGATDAVISKARTDVGTAFDMQVAFTDQQQACNAMVGELAWATS